MTWRAAKEQSPATCTTTRPPLYNIHNNTPLPVWTPIIPFPDSDRCDTTGVHVHPPRRSSPVIRRFCPTLGYMWSMVEDNLLGQTISTKIQLNSYNLDWDVFWNLVAEEIPGLLTQQ